MWFLSWMSGTVIDQNTFIKQAWTPYDRNPSTHRKLNLHEFIDLLRYFNDGFVYMHRFNNLPNLENI